MNFSRKQMKGMYAGDRQADRFCIGVLLVILLTWCLCYSVYAEEKLEVTITNDNPQVGVALDVNVVETTEVSGNSTYKWFRDDVELEYDGLNYTPNTEDYEHWLKVEVYEESECVGQDEIYFSKLPVVYINTDDGKGVTTKEIYKSASMFIQGNGEYPSQYNGSVEIKGRGNTSWSYPQKPYKLKLGKSTNLFGFGKNKHYVLLSNFLDESLCRNIVASNLSKELGLTNMDMISVDVVVNGSYAGNYVLAEHIRIDESRVDIFNWEDEAENIAKAVCNAEDALTKEDQDAIEDLLTEDLSWITSGMFIYDNVTYTILDYYKYDKNNGGYLFELSNEYDEVSKFTTNAGLKVMLNSPEYLNTNEEMMTYVRDYWQGFEDAFMSENGYNNYGQHYSELADLDSMVSYWLTMEIMGNNDAIYKSRYAYMDMNGLITFGPVWDFDWGCASPVVSTSAMGWKVTGGQNAQNFYKEFIDDPYFLLKATERYWDIRPYLEKLIEGGILDSYYNYLYESGCATNLRWPDATVFNRARRGFINDFEVFKKYLAERVAWLDTQFSSETTIVSSIYTKYSANPYIKSDDMLIIMLDNAVQDAISANVPADGLISATETLECTVKVADENTKTIEVYVNGLKLNQNDYVFDVIGGQCAFEVPATALTEESSSKNVVSLIAKDETGHTTYTNFATILVDDTIDTIAAYDYPSETPGTELPGGGTTYPATGGALAEYSTLSASVSANGVDRGVLTYSTDKYADEKGDEAYVPVVAASESSPWGENACYEVKCSTKGHRDIAFTASLGATKKGPRDFKLQYSLDGETYIDVEDSERSLTKNKEMQQLYASFALPDECADRDVLYIRVITASDFLVNGKEELAGSTGGEAAINHVYVRGTEPRYRMTFDSNGGSKIKSIIEKTGAVVNEPETPVKEGCAFGGWYRDEELTEKYEFTTMPAEDITLYAKWIVNVYTITFDSNGGSRVDTVTAEYGAKPEKPADPIREGYTFTGWYSDEALTEEYEFTAMPAEDIMLYAKWEVISFTIVYQDYDGTILKSETVNYGEDGTAPETPVRAGYTFEKWSASIAQITENITVIAVYRKDDVPAAEPPTTELPVTPQPSESTTKLAIFATYKKPVKNQKAKLQTVANVKKITLYTKGIKTAQLSAKIAGSNVVPKWSSSNRKVVTVSKKGKITAKKKGTAYITAKVENTTVRCKVVVKKAKLKVNSPKKGINLTLGETYKLKVTVRPLGKIKYISSNKKVVKVTKNGKLKAVEAGKATITITSNGMKKRIKVLVK